MYRYFIGKIDTKNKIRNRDPERAQVKVLEVDSLAEMSSKHPLEKSVPHRSDIYIILRVL